MQRPARKEEMNRLDPNIFLDDVIYALLWEYPRFNGHVARPESSTIPFVDG